jgi:putative (di)nucleoside polyphosphate hydrolase
MIEASKLPYRNCVGVMLLNADGLAFVGRRAEGAGAAEGDSHWWQMPQGGMDEGEDFETAARRELFEETGVRSITVLARTKDWLRYDLPAPLIGVAWRGRYRGQQQMWFAARFDGEESEIDLGPKPGHHVEFDAWRWVRAAELPNLVVPFKHDVYAAVLAEFAPILGRQSG